MKTRAITFVYLLVIYTLGMGILINLYTTHKEIQFKNINWAKLYPFSQNQVVEKQKVSFIEQTNERIKVLTEKIENRANVYFPQRFMFCEIQAYISKLLKINIFLESENTVLLSNGHLSRLQTKVINHKFHIKKIQEFNDYLHKLNIQFAYIVLPSKTNEKNPILHYKDKSQNWADNFVKSFKDNDIPILDLRNSVKKLNSNPYDFFFKTDHHWLPQTGLWAASEIAKWMNQNFKLNINLELLNQNQFSIQTIKNCYLGSLGKKVTKAITPLEDFYIVKPRYATDFNLLNRTDIDKSGDFEEVMFYPDRYPQNPYGPNSYYYYLGNDWPALTIKNNSKEIPDIKILFIKDSFSNTFAPYLACATKRIDLLDCRYFTGSIKTYISKMKPNIVIIAYTATMNSTNMFQFE